MSQRLAFPSARAAALGTCALLCLLFTALVGHEELVKAITEEGGPVETLSALIWLGAGLVSFAAATRPGRSRLDWLLGGIVLAGLSAREFDFQKRFSDWNLAKPGNYLDPTIPVDERLTVILFAVLPLAAVLLTLLARNVRRFRDAWRRQERWPRDIVLCVVMVVVAGRLDKFHHVMPALGISDEWRYVPVMFEEAIELSVALFVALILVPGWRRAFGAGAGGPPPQ